MTDSADYWNDRYKSGAIWGDKECPSAILANEYFKDNGVRRVLVPGCGYGRNSLYFAKLGYEVTGYDISEVAIYNAKKAVAVENLDINYDVCTISEVAERNSTYDAIYFSNVIHLFTAREREDVLSKLSNQLMPGGLLVFTCLSTIDSNYSKGKEIERNTFMDEKGKILHFFDEGEIDSLLARDYTRIEKKIHDQVEQGPTGVSEVLKLFYVGAQKLA